MNENTEKVTPKVVGHYRIFSNPEAKIVVAVSSYAGKTVRGVAKCHPSDEFDEEFGTKLAISRCAYKVSTKRVERASRKLMSSLVEELMAHQYTEEMRGYLSRADAELQKATEELAELEGVEIPYVH